MGEMTPITDKIQSVVDGDIDLREIGRRVWERKKLIVLVMFLVGAAAAGVAKTRPDIYRADVIMVPASDGRADKKSSALSQLGGIASLAGISLGTPTSSVDENLATLTSRTFLWEFVQENSLMPVLFYEQWDISKKSWKESDVKKQPNLWDAYRLLNNEGVISIEREKKNELLTLVVEWKDPQLAAKWGNELVARLNEYLRLKAIIRSQENLRYLTEALEKTQVQEVRQTLFEMISQEQKSAMLASTQKEFAFKVLDPASSPDKKVKPKRILITLLAALLGGLSAMIYIIVFDKTSLRSS